LERLNVERLNVRTHATLQGLTVRFIREDVLSRDCGTRAPKERQAVAWGVSPRNTGKNSPQAAERRQAFNIDKEDPHRGLICRPCRGFQEI